MLLRKYINFDVWYVKMRYILVYLNAIMNTTMRKTLKITLLLVLLTGGMLYTFADRGMSKKVKNKVKLNIPTNNNFKRALSINLKTGLKYTGSLITAPDHNNFSAFSNSLVTYQKGNTIYVIPYKQKIIVSEIKQGYTGMKLIIKSH